MGAGYARHETLYLFGYDISDNDLRSFSLRALCSRCIMGEPNPRSDEAQTRRFPLLAATQSCLALRRAFSHRSSFNLLLSQMGEFGGQRHIVEVRSETRYGSQLVQLNTLLLHLTSQQLAALRGHCLPVLVASSTSAPRTSPSSASGSTRSRRRSTPNRCK